MEANKSLLSLLSKQFEGMTQIEAEFSSVFYMHLCGPWGHAPGSWNVVASLPVYAPANIELNSVQGAERLISLPPLFSFYQVTGFFTCKSCLCLYFFNGLTLLSFSVLKLSS